MQQPNDLNGLQWVIIVVLCGVIVTLVKVFWSKVERMEESMRARESEYRTELKKIQELQDARDKEREDKLMALAQGGAAERKSIQDFLKQNLEVLTALHKRLPKRGGTGS